MLLFYCQRVKVENYVLLKTFETLFCELRPVGCPCLKENTPDSNSVQYHFNILFWDEKLSENGLNKSYKNEKMPKIHLGCLKSKRQYSQVVLSCWHWIRLRNQIWGNVFFMSRLLSQYTHLFVSNIPTEEFSHQRINCRATGMIQSVNRTTFNIVGNSRIICRCNGLTINNYSIVSFRSTDPLNKINEILRSGHER